MRASVQHLPRCLSQSRSFSQRTASSICTQSLKAHHIQPLHLASTTKRSLHTTRPASDKPTTSPLEPGLKPSTPLHKIVEQLIHSLQNAKQTSHETLKVTDLEAPQTGIIRIVSLDRPKARNAISKTLLRELSEQVEAIYAQAESASTSGGAVRVLVVASEVDESFCAGADLKERKGMERDEVQTFLTSLRRTFSRLSTLPIPTIASVSGAALGGGLELALCTTMRVLSSNALLALPETRLAIIPGAGGTYRLPAIIGRSAALDLILTGRRIGAAEAGAMGLGKAPEEDGEAELDARGKRLLALSRALGLAREISKGGPLAVAAAMRAVAEGPNEVAENVAYDSLLNSKDRVEALVAFGEKRQPQFKGE